MDNNKRKHKGLNYAKKSVFYGDKYNFNVIVCKKIILTYS